eukprot:scaffold879_cov170-Ochromonas_danica.AAC.5
MDDYFKSENHHHHETTNNRLDAEGNVNVVPIPDILMWKQFSRSSGSSFSPNASYDERDVKGIDDIGGSLLPEDHSKSLTTTTTTTGLPTMAAFDPAVVLPLSNSAIPSPCGGDDDLNDIIVRLPSEQQLLQQQQPQPIQPKQQQNSIPGSPFDNTPIAQSASTLQTAAFGSPFREQPISNLSEDQVMTSLFPSPTVYTSRKRLTAEESIAVKSIDRAASFSIGQESPLIIQDRLGIAFNSRLPCQSLDSLMMEVATPASGSKRHRSSSGEKRLQSSVIGFEECELIAEGDDEGSRRSPSPQPPPLLPSSTTTTTLSLEVPRICLQPLPPPISPNKTHKTINSNHHKHNNNHKTTNTNTTNTNVTNTNTTTSASNWLDDLVPVTISDSYDYHDDSIDDIVPDDKQQLHRPQQPSSTSASRRQSYDVGNSSSFRLSSAYSDLTYSNYSSAIHSFHEAMHTLNTTSEEDGNNPNNDCYFPSDLDVKDMII